MYSPPMDNYQQNGHWYSSHPSSHSTVPVLMPMSNAEHLQLQHRLSVNVTDHYEWTTNPNNYYSGYPPPATSSNFDTLSLNGSLSSGTSTNDSPPYPLITPIPTVYVNQYPTASIPAEQQQQRYCPQPGNYPTPPIPTRLASEAGPQAMLHDPLTNKFVFFIKINAVRFKSLFTSEI